jgi:hypothetical protein
MAGTSAVVEFAGSFGRFRRAPLVGYGQDNRKNACSKPRITEFFESPIYRDNLIRPTSTL